MPSRPSPNTDVLSRIKIVLVNTSHPGNIGASARAMANMGLTRLALVDPIDFPCIKATARAAGADDVLENAQICPNLAEAVADCTFVYGTTARLRSITWPEHSPQALAEEIRKSVPGQNIALVFGRERTGLSNKELDLCQALVHIPVDEMHTSINLGSAVMVIAYALRSALVDDLDNPNEIGRKNISPPVDSEQLQYYFNALDKLLKRIDFYKGNATRVMRKLRRIYYKSDASEEDVSILLGTISSINKALDEKKK